MVAVVLAALNVPVAGLVIYLASARRKDLLLTLLMELRRRRR